MQKINKLFLLLICVLFLISCNTLKQPSFVPKPLDYTDEDIVKNEIKTINEFLDAEPIKALYRSVLLGDEEVISKSLDKVVEVTEKAYEEGNHTKAYKYYKSIKLVLEKSSLYNPLLVISEEDKNKLKYSDKEIASLIKDDVPALSIDASDNNKAPQRMEDCINATATIWVDRGVKVEKGAGYADIIIGSGFFIDKRGYLVTNYHVIDSMVNPKYEGYSRLYIKLPSNMENKIPAKVVGYDSLLDLALLKVEIEPEFVLNLGSSDGLRVGDKVSAIGTPLGLEGTLTSGIISATDRKLLNMGDVFQLDAAVNSGNSGGPLIDKNMNVQAIVFAGIPQFQGLNFAIPIEYLIQELPRLYEGGEVVHPWIGASGKTKKNGNKKTGLEIQYVMPGSSAFMAGLSVGDVIVEIDDRNVSSLEDFQYVMLGYENETILTMKYIPFDNQSSVKEILIYLDKRPKAPSKEIYNTDYITNAFVPLFGMELINSSTLNKNSFTITKVLDNSPADELSFSVNDIIEVREVTFDDENDALYVTVYTKRQKKGFFDIIMGLGTNYDSPYYF